MRSLVVVASRTRRFIITSRTPCRGLRMILLGQGEVGLEALEVSDVGAVEVEGPVRAGPVGAKLDPHLLCLLLRRRRSATRAAYAMPVKGRGPAPARPIHVDNSSLVLVGTSLQVHL